MSVEHTDQRAEAIPCSTATPNWTVHVSDVRNLFYLVALVCTAIVIYMIRNQCYVSSVNRNKYLHAINSKTFATNSNNI